ncbi:MAG: sporulation initiation factor Spo0A C-terminal domain-containing protein [Ruminococcus sp.]|nr:sporulation initiation factor Spo0A C-terminal domain-containing protein [Ruminococcus sp.]
MIHEKNITELLIRLGNQPNNKGFTFLRTGMLLCLEDRELCRNLSKGFYSRVAVHYGTTPAAVERNIRFAINQGWSKRDKALSEQIFRSFLQSERDVPTNSLYIAALAEWLAAHQDSLSSSP